MTEKQAEGSDAAALQSDGFNYLCPECGGYGQVPTYRKHINKSGQKTCVFCKGSGYMDLTDSRVKDNPQADKGRRFD